MRQLERIKPKGTAFHVGLDGRIVFITKLREVNGRGDGDVVLEKLDTSSHELMDL